MIRSSLSIYLPGYPKTLVYMLQSTEYQAVSYLRWIWRTKDFSGVMQRRTLELTRPARMLLGALYLGIGAELVLGLILVALGLQDRLDGGIVYGTALILIYPILWAHLLVVPVALGRIFVIKPREDELVAKAEPLFASHPGVKIAVVGSYGKTTMKELLKTVLSEGLKVAATPANKNVAISHARFASSLEGDEDVLIIEYGEGAPGDVASFAALTHPTHAVITGLAPAHLDQYGTLEAAGRDIFSVADSVAAKQVYVNGDSPEAKVFTKKSFKKFDTTGALGWKVSAIKTTLDGTSFTLKKGKRTLKLKSSLVGTHQVGFLALVAALALDLGLSPKQVEAGIVKTKPFEHRMQPYQLNGAWIIDDTYNGNLEGIRAGTQLLKDLKAKRKIYVTPGLVDQGKETKRVHIEVGELIAAAKPSTVVLMQNSVTRYIEKGLQNYGFAGEIQLQEIPLEYYTNLSHHVAKGDLVLMQNDWTDNYA